MITPVLDPTVELTSKLIFSIDRIAVRLTLIWPRIEFFLRGIDGIQE
jgi:hypothetical protein